MKYIFSVISILFILLAKGQSLKEYKVNIAAEPIVVDGLLNESSWQQAPFTQEFVTIQGNPTSTVTKTKILWDSNYLYIGFVSEDNSIWSTLKGRDSHLWNQDVVEIFIDPDGDGLNYIEMGFSPNGNFYDYLISKELQHGGEINSGWNIKGVVSKVNINGKINATDGATDWTCEIAIPFEGVPNSPVSIIKPNVMDTWRINFCRVDYNYKDSENVRYFTWNPINRSSFHIPSRFGKIVFNKPMNK